MQIAKVCPCAPKMIAVFRKPFWIVRRLADEYHREGDGLRQEEAQPNWLAFSITLGFCLADRYHLDFPLP